MRTKHKTSQTPLTRKSSPQNISITTPNSDSCFSFSLFTQYRSVPVPFTIQIFYESAETRTQKRHDILGWQMMMFESELSCISSSSSSFSSHFYAHFYDDEKHVRNRIELEKICVCCLSHIECVCVKTLTQTFSIHLPPVFGPPTLG